MSRITWKQDTLTPGVKAFGPKLFDALDKYMSFKETKIQDAMRDGAPWQDRTGNARQGLFARNVSQAGSNTFTIVLYHTVPYGIWLEVANGGKYAIIIPTLQSEAQSIMSGMTKLISKMRSFDVA